MHLFVVGVTQLTRLDHNTVARLCSQVFPQLLSETEFEYVEHLPEQWISEFWQYLADWFPDDLSLFEGIHLLPDGNGKLLPLNRNKAVIVVGYNDSTLPDDMIDVCRRLGIRVIENMLLSICNRHDVWGRYVIRPDAEGVLTALSRLDTEKMIQMFLALSTSDKRLFRTYILSSAVAKPDVLYAGHNVLRDLPMFETLPVISEEHTTDGERETVSLKEVSVAGPVPLLPVKLPEAVLDASDPVLQKLLPEMEIEIMSISECLKRFMFPAINAELYSVQQVEDLMKFVCDQWQTLSRDPCFVSSVRNVRFVECSSGDLVISSDLFDGNDPTLRILFRRQDVFPVGAFASHKYANIMHDVGLKGQESVTATDIYRVIQSLDQCCTDEVEIAETVLSFLEQHWKLLSEILCSGCSLTEALKAHPWVPFQRCRPHQYPQALRLCHNNSEIVLCTPDDVTSVDFCHLIGSVKLMVNTAKIPNLARKFLWNEEPDARNVIAHLLNVSADYIPNETAEFTLILRDIYNYLNQRESLSELHHFLENENWIFHGCGFAEVKHVVRCKPFTDFRPHVYVLYDEFVQFESLWNSVGLENDCSLLDVVNSIASVHDGQEHQTDVVKRDLKLLVDILNEIASFDDTALLEIRDNLLVPIDRGENILQMKPVGECTYCDPEWYNQEYQYDDDINLIHHLIPTDTAIRLNIHSIVSRTLNAEELDIGMTSYGQREELTTRIKTLLQREYTDGLAVIKELIQNADDAVATEVKLLYDERENSQAQVKLLDPGMKSLQGPALWVYNDSTFRDHDFDNLVKLNAATKQHCTDKVGQFGLGFNAVYNLTDVPALISQNYLVYLDPHTKYLGKAIRDKPGIKLNLKASGKWLGYYSHQFEPFNGIFGCQLTGSSALTDYGGTLFRFPLRTEDQSKDSRISSKHYSRDEMVSLLSMFREAADSLLLFAQNVTKVSVFHLSPESNSSQDMREVFSVTKSMERVLRSPRSGDERPFAVLEYASRMMKQGKVDNISSVQFSYLVKMSVESQEDTENVFRFKQPSQNTYWLTSMCLGQKESLTISLEKGDRVPLGGVAARLEKQENQDFAAISVSRCTGSFRGGIVFCFLPLPLTSASGLPVHINGYFAIDSNRKHLAMKAADQKSNDDAVWNEHLITDAVKSSYEILLEDVLELCPNSEPFSVWPEYGASAKDDIVSQLVEILYYDISSEDGGAVCRVNNRCVPFRMCKMLDVDFRKSAIGENAQRVFEQVNSTDFEVLDLPAKVLQSMLKTSAKRNVCDQIISKVEFYERWFLPNIAKADRALRDKLVISALFDDDIRNLLLIVDCVPVRPNGILRNPSDLIDPSSRLATLYDEEDDVFPLIKEEYMEGHLLEDIYSKLVSVGMKRDNLPWKELADRCAVVTQKRKLVPERRQILIQLMSRNVDSVSPEDEEYINQIRGERFLPVKRKLHGFPLPWKGDDVGQYTSSNEAYLSDRTSLVCCSYPIVDENDKFRLENLKLKEKLQLIKPVDGETVLYQLDCIICRLREHDKHAKERTTNLSKVSEFCSDIYRYFKALLEKQECQDVVQELCTKQCILVQTSYVLMYPEHCARQVPVGSDVLLPYLYGIPFTMNRLYDVFLETVGVKKAFAAKDYVGVLRRMKDEHTYKPLSDHDLKVAIAIINDCLPKCSDLPAASDVYVPNTAARLCSADNVCMNIYCDWIDEDDVEGNICHKKISPYAARQLGIRTIRQEYLMQNSDDFGLPFGQEEELTTRLHNIIRDYRCDETVLKEMLQNADDAGATQLHLINDTRTLPDDSVFDDSWKPLQGPALCVYNNKPFTEDDLQGIQKLGKGSKGNDATKTGQYGVGFNCVYHLTDVPSLLTSVDGEQILCIFDPHCSYIPGSSKQRPGRRLKNTEQLKSRFPDAFYGYLLREYGEKGGSLFRLPLRSADMSEKSKISDNVVTSDTVQELFTVFQRDMYKSLLFLNSVEEISLMTIHAYSANGASTVNFSVTAKMSQEARRDRETFMNAVKRVAKELKSNTQVPEKGHTLERVCYELTTEDSEGNSDEWLIVQCLGFDSSRDSDCLSDVYAPGSIDLLPRAGVAHLTSSSRDSASGNQLFCFLPLTDAQLDMPVNVNGHFFLNCEARQNLWAERNADWKSKWNMCLMKNAVAPAYCTLIERRRQETDKLLQNTQQHHPHSLAYFSVFPTISDKQDSYVTALCESVYRRLQDEAALPVYSFSNNQFTWLKPANHSVRDGFFDDLDFQLSWSARNVQQDRRVADEGKQVVNVRQSIRNILLKCGLKLFYCPVHIYTNFLAAGVSVKILHPENVLEFFMTYCTEETSCLVHEVDIPINETLYEDVGTIVNLLKYCARADQYKRLLNGTPLLVTSDNHLRMFDHSCVKYEPRFADIFLHIPEQFMHQSIFDALKLDPVSDTHLCQKLTIHKFAEELPFVLPKAVFHGANKRVCIDEASKCLPAVTSFSLWIRQVWKFLYTMFTETDQIPKHWQLAEWCILPAIRGTEGILVPIRCAPCVVGVTTSRFAERLDRVLMKIGVLRPSSELTSDIDVFSFYHRCLGSTEKPDTVLAALQEVLKANGSFNCTLSVDDSSVLQKYFNENISVVDEIRAAATIKQLPIFCTVFHEMVSIANARAYIICDHIPSTKVDCICTIEEIVLLESSSNVESLLLRLGCGKMHVVTFYCNFFFKHCHTLSNDDRMIHLEYIRDSVLKKLESQAENKSHLQTLLRCLRQLAFIPRMAGNMLAKASEFHDSSVKLLRVMHEETDFPPDPFKEKDWTTFLRKCGLVYEVTHNMFLCYCRRVASSPKSQITDRIHTQSKVLLKYLFSHKELLQQTALIHELSRVKFIVPHSVGSLRESFCEQYGERNNDGGLCLVEFANSISSSSADAVWSAQSVVPQSVFELMQKCATRDQICSELGFHRAPELPNVVKHTVQLCKNLVPKVKQKISADELREISSILGTIYGVLSTFTELPENAETTCTLSQTSFIIDSDKRLLVRPNQVVLRLSEKDEIVPYLISMPRGILAYERMFCQLGARETPSPDQYAMVLRMIHADSGDEIMHPNEREKAKRAMYGLFCLLQSTEEDEFTINGKLYLPGGHEEEWKMYEACTLMVDDARLRPRLKSFEEPFMLSLRECHIRTTNYSSRDLISRLPEANRPKFLSKVVEEIVDTDHRVTDCPVARRISEKFSSEDFRVALMRIALHSLCKKPTEEDTERVQKAVEGLETIQVLGVDKLTTYLMYDGMRMQDSECEKPFHVSRENSESEITIFVCSNREMSPAFSEKLTEVVGCVVGDIIKFGKYLLSRIIECDAGTANQYLDEKEIPSYGMEQSDPAADSFTPIPGSFVPLVHHHLLKQEVHRLNPGEFAAMETDDPVENDEPGPPTYILVKIVGIVEDEDNSEVGTAALRYRVLVGPNQEMVVSVLVLYAFTRDQEEIEQTSDSFSMELDIHDQHAQPSATPVKPQAPADYDTIVKDLRQQLKEAWKMPEPQRKKFVKRLLLRWHPDKNPDNTYLATKVTQFILDILDRLERGLAVDDADEGGDGANRYHHWSSGTGNSWAGFHRTFYEHMNQRARQHQQQFQNNYRRRRRRGGFFTQFHMYPNPQPGEARRWLRQANADIDAAVNDKGCGHCDAFEWACYKYYQVYSFKYLAN